MSSETTSPSPGAEPSPDERNWAVLSHVLALLAALFVLGQVLVPLGIWLWKKDESPFIGAHARESLNFQLSMTIYFVVAGVLVYLVIGFFLLVILAAVELVCVLLAAVHASRGEAYRYPFSLRLIS